VSMGPALREMRRQQQESNDFAAESCDAQSADSEVRTNTPIELRSPLPKALGGV
jgi:hypothetical protein